MQTQSELLTCTVWRREDRDRQTDRQNQPEKERKRERARDRQTDKLADRQTGRQTDSQTDRQTDRHREIHTHINRETINSKTERDSFMVQRHCTAPETEIDIIKTERRTERQTDAEKE
mgnify:CR=1 FL=1